jgi:HD-GYP domain-containing protein (c-di-GMP phosphodiesterase class II)
VLDPSGALVYRLVDKVLKDEKFHGEHSPFIEKMRKIRAQMDLLQADICVPSFFKKKLLGILVLGEKINGGEFSREELGFFLTLSNDTAMAISNAQLIESLQDKVDQIETLYEKSHRLFIHTSIALATAIDARDPYTHGHTQRVTAYCLIIAEEMQHSPEVQAFDNFRETLHISALLHDIGKIGIPDNILNKKDKLTPQEFAKIREHPAIGATILYPIRELGMVLGGVRSHQERFDGTGYPDRLKGKQIPLLARIIAVADTFDAITTIRPYKDKRSAEDAASEITRCSGNQFDPDVVEAFLKAYNKKKFSDIIDYH